MAAITQSYVYGTSDTPLLGATVGAVFERTVADHRDDAALIVRHQGVRWTYGELAERVDALAAGLAALGLRPGDRLGIWAPNCAEWVLTQFAAAKAGLILVNINPAYRLGEVEFALNRVGCRALVTAAAFKTSDYLAMLGELAPELAAARPGELSSPRLPDLRWVIVIGEGARAGTLPFAEVAGRAGAPQRRALADLGRTLQFDDPINIQFTSGTTGTPKAATLSHHNIVNNAYFSARILRFSPRDRLCIPVPMYHCFGMVLGTLLCVTHGATMVFPSAGFEAGATLAAIDEERCTALHGVPTMFIAALDEPNFRSYDLGSLRTGIMAGAPCPLELMHRVIAEMHLPEITIGYGMTETGPLSFQSAVDDPVERRIGSVGRVMAHTEAKIVDAEGRIVPVGTPGELLTRGYCVMLGYWNDPQKTAEAIDPARWIKTGDIATLDGDGYGNIVGRLKDMLIRGGENIFPREIEEFLYTNLKIDQVEVFGVPDRKYGEEVCAWIRLKTGETATEDQIRDFCRGRIAHYKIPRHVRFVEEFPMTVTGKVQKYRMREQMIAELGLAEAETA